MTWLLIAEELHCFCLYFCTNLYLPITVGQIDTIRKWTACLLLVLFAVSITPKVIFHDVLAGHKDGLVCQDTDKSAPHLHKPAFHCSFDDLVVSSPYLLAELRKSPEPIYFFQQVFAHFPSPALSTLFLHKESRGPPLMWFSFQPTSSDPFL